MDTDHDFSYKRDTNWKHQNPYYTKPRSTKHDLCHHLRPNCNEKNKHWVFESVLVCSYAPRNAYVHFPEIPGTSYGTNT